MSARHICNRCRQEIAVERTRLSPIVCDNCGQVASRNEYHVEEGIQRSFTVITAVSSAAIIAVFVALASWGSYALTGPLLKLREWTWTHSKASTTRLADICMELKKYSCAEEALESLYKKQKDASAGLRLGKLQMQQKRYRLAAETYKSYFAQKRPTNLEAHYLYGRALAEMGQIDAAARQFDIVLRAKPDVLQVTVAQNYVRYLVQANRVAQARQVIQRIRSRGQTASMFMDSEYKALSARI